MTIEEFKAFANEQVRKNREARKKEAERQARIATQEREWEEAHENHTYEIRATRGYYEVLRDGKFYCSADTYGEAMREIPD